MSNADSILQQLSEEELQYVRRICGKPTIFVTQESDCVDPSKICKCQMLRQWETAYRLDLLEKKELDGKPSPYVTIDGNKLYVKCIENFSEIPESTDLFFQSHFFTSNDFITMILKQSIKLEKEIDAYKEIMYKAIIRQGSITKI